METVIHMLVTTPTGPTLKCGVLYEPGVVITEIPEHVTCPKCAKD